MSFNDSKGKQSILSGLQPSGQLHIGNYFGSLKQFLSFQNNDNIAECYFMIADVHSLNTIPNPNTLRAQTINTVASLIGCGINKSTLFCQSHVPYHTELTSYLGSVVGIGRLERMTQFKDKSIKGSKESENLALLSYPVLQAADILLYQTNIVPVGIDQVQHLELTKHIAQRFNSLYNCKAFTLPEVLINKNAEKIMSLSDGKKKMSKSSLQQDSCVNLTDSNEQILKKLKKAKTDSINGISYDESRPEISNLVTILANCTNQTIQEVVNQYQSYKNASFKQEIADALIAMIEPIRAKIELYKSDERLLLSEMANGKERALKESSKTIAIVKNAMGLLGCL
ncbi:MAG: tryptophan--tRNA ligase [Alphaproteobacteria bacterium]|nr:tryptophan--tRNA ligase [Rickettsiales bacterium]